MFEGKSNENLEVNMIHNVNLNFRAVLAPIPLDRLFVFFASFYCNSIKTLLFVVKKVIFLKTLAYFLVGVIDNMSPMETNMSG